MRGGGTAKAAPYVRKAALRWSPIDGGRAGRQLFATFGRDAQTRIVAPVGNSHYNSLQARLDRRFANGFQFGVRYTLSRSGGIAGADNSDGVPRIAIPEFYRLNEALSGFDRTHNLQLTNITALPFGRNRRWLNGGGAAAAIAGGWQVNGVLSFYTGTPFSITASGTSLNALVRTEGEGFRRASQTGGEERLPGDAHVSRRGRNGLLTTSAAARPPERPARPAC